MRLLDPLQGPGDHPPAERHDDREEAEDLERGESERGLCVLTGAPAWAEEDWKEEQQADGQYVLHDGPTDCDVADGRVQVPPFTEHQRHHDSAGTEIAMPRTSPEVQLQPVR